MNGDMYGYALPLSASLNWSLSLVTSESEYGCIRSNEIFDFCLHRRLINDERDRGIGLMLTGEMLMLDYIEEY